MVFVHSLQRVHINLYESTRPLDAVDVQAALSLGMQPLRTGSCGCSKPCPLCLLATTSPLPPSPPGLLHCVPCAQEPGGQAEPNTLSPCLCSFLKSPIQTCPIHPPCPPPSGLLHCLPCVQEPGGQAAWQHAGGAHRSGLQWRGARSCALATSLIYKLYIIICKLVTPQGCPHLSHCLQACPMLPAD